MKKINVGASQRREFSGSIDARGRGLIWPLRFFPDESVGYGYPETCVKWFGLNFQPEPYIVDEYKRARDHKYYMTGRLIALHDLYSHRPRCQGRA
jgi:hypothetical protein